MKDSAKVRGPAKDALHAAMEYILGDAGPEENQAENKTENGEV